MRTYLVLVAAAAAVLAAGNSGVDRSRLKVFSRLPDAVPSASNPTTEAKVKLGRMLFYEPRLSKNQKVSCNSCHQLDRYGVDNKPVSTGHKNLTGDRNSPTVYNAAAHIAQFWDGRAPDVEEQAKGPVMNPVEMAMSSESHVIAVLNSIPEYVKAFQKAFPESKAPVSFDNMARAIGAFERKLLTPSRWDRFLAGDDSALNAAELNGLNKFLEHGCQSCHNGALLGGTVYQKLGIAKPWPKDADHGRMKVTQRPQDRFVFKVPSLRNIDKTGPYFHDGSVAGLNQAIQSMAEYQTGKNLQPSDAQAIGVFLKALTGDIPQDLIREPKLPASTFRTPKPDTE